MSDSESSSAAQNLSLGGQRVLVLHNRYRQAGGEENYAKQLCDLLHREAAHCSFLERSSSDAGALNAGAALLRGGLNPRAVRAAVEQHAITVVHAHNVLPSFGWRALAAARQGGAAVVLHLHNYRLFCAIGTAFRNGKDCDECAPRSTGAGLRHNCRGSLPQAAAYAYGLRRWQQSLIENVDHFVAPVAQVGDDFKELGLELQVSELPSWLPDVDFANYSQCADGEYVLYVGRITEEKGIFVAIEAAAESGVTMKVAGDGPEIQRARARAAELAAPVEFLGRLDGQALVAARMGASFAVLPSIWREVLPLSALEAIASGLPLVVSDRGGLPELTDPELTVPAGDARALARTMRSLFDSKEARAAAGQRALERGKARFGEAAYLSRLAAVYGKARAAREAAAR